LPLQDFNADWIIDGEPQPKSLFNMIKNTFKQAPDYVLSAYKDNAAVDVRISGWIVSLPCWKAASTITIKDRSIS
jgi:phosphoribosylformylglycinamidine (FGAM) synthase-like enzyme